MAESVRWPGHAVLQAPVPVLDDFVRSRFEHYDRSLLGRSDLAGEDFVHAHVTVLGPFDQLPGPAQVEELVACLRPFAAHCRRVDVFGNGIIHAPAEPSARFVEWTEQARRVFSSVEPYRGQFDVDPHVTLDAIGPGVDADWVRSRVELPVDWTADVLDLVWYEQDATRLVARWRLGASTSSAGDHSWKTSMFAPSLFRRAGRSS